MNEILEKGSFTGVGLLESLTGEFVIARLDGNTQSILCKNFPTGLPFIVPVVQVTKEIAESEHTSPVHLGIFNYGEEAVLDMNFISFAEMTLNVMADLGTISSQEKDPNSQFVAQIRETLEKFLPEHELI